MTNMDQYQTFLKSKTLAFRATGFDVAENDLHPVLKPHQQALTRWSLRKGRAAVFADTGLGKTPIQLEWARHVFKQTQLPVLIVAPLSVARQTVNEGKRLLGMNVHYSRSGSDIDAVTITNYEMVEHFNPASFGGIVLDESSILKSIDGKIKARLIEMFGETPYKLCCTATPAPNDISEIANHSEFLGIMSRVEMLAQFFVHDDEGWRLKGHATEAFYKWLASWGMSVRLPSDIGFSDDGYILPPLSIEPVFVATEYRPDDQLFFTGLKGVQDRSKVRRATLEERCQAAADLVNADSEQWLVWCGLNPESKLLASLIPGSMEVTGSDSPDDKIAAFEAFQDGRIRVLVTKAKIAGFGMNFQNSHKAVFVGLSDSYELYYQAIRRQYRFGQDKPVEIKIVLSEIEDAIYHNILAKEEQARKMSNQLIRHVQQYEQEEIGRSDMATSWTYQENEAAGQDWRLLLGDSVERMRELYDNSVDLSVFSPPFASLYTYSPTERDLGNSRTEDEFYTHFGFIIDELLRITRPGRICAVHVADVPAMLVRDGYIGLKDFSGDVIRQFIAHGWTFDARIPIDKNQQAQSIRTHSKALTMSQMRKDRTWLRPALPDYILKFRKPGENANPVESGMTGDEWIELANPTWPGENNDRCADAGAFATWYGIKESDTLQGWQNARGEQDERHICPLQLGTIERCIRLWSNPGELIFSPFAGIGSELYVAVKLNRRALGIELKPEYWKQSVKNMRRLERGMRQDDLFSWAGTGVNGNGNGRK